MGDVFPVHYTLHIIPNLKDFNFEGNVNIDLKASELINQVVLNVLDISVKYILLRETKLTYSIDLEKQELTIDLPDALTGEFSLEIEYSGEISDKLSGFYRSKYDINGESKYCAVSQFQESDARRAFPCFDEPGKKATYDISFTVNQSDTAISNTSIAEEKILDNGKKHVTFERTPVMSTYLVFLGVGDFEWIEGTYKQIPVRVVASPDKAQKYGQLGLDYATKSLEFCDDFFKIDYPLSKMDHIATPDFAAGAMENWGAVLYRESALLFYPGITSKSNELSIKITIAHETIHQWNGNIVSPASWKYVWLNESFATYISFKIVNFYEPQYHVWDYFLSKSTNQALTADAYHETVPIEIPGENKVAYTVKSIPILYDKGASVLRQLNVYLGDEQFQNGIHYYLKKYLYGVATSDQLWESLEEHTGKPIENMMKTWILQYGYPKITVSFEGKKIKLTQDRFTYLENSDQTLWHIPITVRVISKGKEYQVMDLMIEKEKLLEIPYDYDIIKLNIDQTGFYRVKYDIDLLTKLGQSIRDKTINNIDRWSLENDLYAFLRSGDVDLDTYIHFLENYQNEDNHLPISNISGHLNSLFNVLQGSAREKVARVGRVFLEIMLENIRYSQKENEDNSITMLRGGLLLNASKFGSSKTTEIAMKLFNLLKNNEKIDPNLLSSVLQIGMRETGDYDWFVKQFNKAETEVEKIYYGSSISQIKDTSKIEKYQTFIFENIPARNRGQAIFGLCQNEIAKPTIWEWYLANLDNFEKLHPFIYQGALTQVIIASVDHKDEVKQFFSEYVKKNPQVQDPVDKALETMEIHAILKDKYNK